MKPRCQRRYYLLVSIIAYWKLQQFRVERLVNLRIFNLIINLYREEREIQIQAKAFSNLT